MQMPGSMLLVCLVMQHCTTHQLMQMTKHLTMTHIAVGGLCQGIAFPVNLGRFGNSFALFLGVEPAEIFLYVFLPPILFDAAVRIDFYVFKKVLTMCSAIPLLPRMRGC